MLMGLDYAKQISSEAALALDNGAGEAINFSIYGRPAISWSERRLGTQRKESENLAKVVAESQADADTKTIEGTKVASLPDLSMQNS